MPEVFALVREASNRVLQMRHFDVDYWWRSTPRRAHSRNETGEGKTLVATLAVVLNALAGKGVHVITVNDYLAKRVSQPGWPNLQFLGLKALA